MIRHVLTPASRAAPAWLAVLATTVAMVDPFDSSIGATCAADWSDRLQALTPSDPDAYFLLAEEVSDAAADESELALAKHLFALAAVLDPIDLGQSACLALADLESEETQRRRFNALATLLAQRRGRAPLVVEEATGGAAFAVSPVMMLALSEAFSYYRQGDGANALNTLRQAGAIELLESNDAIVPGGSGRFLEDSRRYRGGETRPALSERELIDMLRLEAALLAGNNRTWSGDLLLNHESPLIEVDPEHIEESLGVDGRRTIYRNGRWILPPDD